MLFIWIFFSTLLPKFSRKICILGCFSQLRYRGGEIRCSQHSFSDPDPQRDGTHFMYSTWNQCSPQPQPPILLVIQVLCKLPAANIVQHRLKTQTEILAFQETPGKKYFTYSLSTPAQQCCDSPQHQALTPLTAACSVPQRKLLRHMQGVPPARLLIEQLQQLLHNFPNARGIKGSLVSRGFLPRKQRSHWSTEPAGHELCPALSSCTAEGCWAQPHSPLILSQFRSCKQPWKVFLLWYFHTWRLFLTEHFCNYKPILSNSLVLTQKHTDTRNIQQV